MNKDNPFAIFKKYQVTFKEGEVEKAYQLKKKIGMPFHSLGIIIGYYIFSSLYGFAFFIMTYFGITNYENGLYWGIISFIPVIVIGISSFTMNKWTKYNNCAGVFVLLFIYFFKIESCRQTETLIGILFYIAIMQIIFVMIWVEYMSSILIGIITQFIGILYTSIRLGISDEFTNWEIYTYGGVMMFGLFCGTIFGFTRLRKLTFYHLYKNIQLQKNWKEVMDLLPNGIAIIQDKKLTYHNQQICKIFNISENIGEIEKSFVIFEELYKCLPMICESEWSDSSLERIYSRQTSIHEDIVYSRDKTLSLSWKYLQLEDRVNSLIIAIKDISTIKELEDAKIRVKNKGMLMATITHDMKTPCQSILGMLEIINESIPNHLLKFTKIAKSSCLLLVHLIHDILDYSKIENNQISLNIESFNLNKAIEEVIEMISFQAETKNIELIIKNESFSNVIFTDMKRFQQILLNLLSNSLKFTFNGFIKIKTKSKIISDTNLISISVSDTGVGIKEENIKELFHAFGMLNDTKTINKYGTGLGLFLSKNLCELMGGGIKVKSLFGEGTKFSFWFENQNINRIQNSSCSTAKLLSDIDEGRDKIDLHLYQTDYNQSILVEDSINMELVTKGGKVLIVDDSPFVLFTINNLLNLLNVPSISASSGIDAVHIIEDHLNEIVFVLMDCNMPIQSGIETTLILKNMLNCETKLPIIGLTGYEDQETIHQCYAAGMDYVCIKPISLDKLRDITNLYL